MGLKLFARFRKDEAPKAPPVPSPPCAAPAQPVEPFIPATCVPLDPDPLRAMLQQGRCALIINDLARWRSHPDFDDVMEACEQRLESELALVPAGEITMSRTLCPEPGGPEDVVQVDAFLIDECCVTNAQFQRFVDGGGYDDLSLWPEDIWPHLIEMKDQTGTSAPRYWREGHHDQRLADHPVVGVCWYEARAYAAWAGKRLPTEAEWQMACSWHIKSDADVLRRFPWGDAMNAQRCNVWLSGIGKTVPVKSYPNGAAPNQVLQLVGNVWEWTDSRFDILDPNGQPIVGEMPMYSIRGGAFDTYFESQATSQFRTGQIALARTHNVGFRCALSLDRAPWMTA